MMISAPAPKKRVAYFYDDEIGNFYYGPGHPMKPHRIRMTHNLVLSYGMYRKMEIYRPQLTTAEEMTFFHADDYIYFLQMVNPDNQEEYQREFGKFNIDVDCPVFDGLFKFCQMYTGGSVGGAYKLNQGTADIAVNWAGGLHHAKKSEASGFCYVNDIVLAILELLKYHARVLYIDIDIHHGDGVEEAFYTTDRVMTVSFHKFGDYFPGTGSIKDIGVGKGKNYSINFPLQDGIDDETFEGIFQPVIQRVMDFYQPGAIVLQCGADSLTGDRLGCFNLTLKGHGSCVEFVRKFNVPVLVLGGGGYTVRNVARCWANETGILLDAKLPDEIPYNEYYEYYGPSFSLSIPPSNMENLNSNRYLDKTKQTIFEILRDLQPAPSVQFKQAPRDRPVDDSVEPDPDVRVSTADMDKEVANPNEFFNSDKDQDPTKDSTKTSQPSQPSPPMPPPSSSSSSSSSGGGHSMDM